MGSERKRLKVYELNSVQPNTYFGSNSIVRLLPGSVHGLFRIDDVFPSWMIPGQVKSVKVQVGVYGNATNVRMHKSTDASTWDSNEVTWNNADTIPVPVPWTTPGCAFASGNIQANCSGTTETLIFANGFILTDVLAAVGGNYTEIRRGYVFSIDHLVGQSIVLDTIRSLNNPVLLLELKSPVIVYVTPISAPAGAPFVVYVYVEPGDEPVTGFNLVQGVTSTAPISYTVELQLPNGYKLYRLSMPAMIAGPYEVQLETANYEYRYGLNFVVGADSYTTFFGTMANNFIIGAGSGLDMEFIADAAVQLRASAIYSAAMHVAINGNPHAMTALDLGGDDIIAAINSGTMKIDVSRLNSDVMTSTEHHDTSVADHHDFALGSGVLSFGIAGSSITYTGYTKIKADPLITNAGIVLSEDAVANGVRVGIDQSIIATKVYVQSLIGGIDWQQPILDFVAVLPGAPSSGERYILTTDNHINEWDGSSWVDTTPDIGFAAYDIADGFAYRYNGTGWILFANAFNHNGLSGIQGGASADYQHLTTAQVGNIHARSHAITSTTDHTAANWSVFYSNGSGQIVALAIGANGEVLTSNGATSAPSFAAGGGGGGHARSHAMTNASDHSAGNWSVFYSNGLGQVVELPLTVSGFLKSNSATLAPSFGNPLGGTGTDEHMTRWDGTGAIQNSLNTIDDSGNTVIAGNLKASGSTKAAGVFYTGTTDPTNTNRLNYDGYLYAARMYNSVYNDLVDFIPTTNQITEVQYGRVYMMDADGYAYIANRRRAKNVIGIASDTYGYGLGQKKGYYQLPISVAGIVLANVDKIYDSGTPLVCDRFGNLTKATLWDKLFYNERIIAKFLRTEKSKVWNGVVVFSRHWVKVVR